MPIPFGGMGCLAASRRPRLPRTLENQTHAVSYLDADPDKPTLEILNDVRVASQSQPHMPSLALGPFAALLVRLSNEASVTADKNLLTQRRMIVVTAIVLVISVAQLMLALLQLSARNSIDRPRVEAVRQPAGSEADRNDLATPEKPLGPVREQ